MTLPRHESSQLGHERRPSVELVTAIVQGLTLVHFSAKTKPFLVTEATASVHFSLQPEKLLPMRHLNISHKCCSRPAGKWTSVVHKKCIR
jgi:hypothetical protein